MKGTTGIRLRRESARKLLEAQLKRGTKPEKVDGKTTNNMIPLTETDKKGIIKEIEILGGIKKKQ